ncbi:hypothetical protein TRICI_003029 [Trichomonascus ciferrii]|uniref:Extracellular membrane protein CFEM domain-containing protein n=1 Tax=Trichomonascus ciferrii TaxID=44093 RepID=A0A642V541_9ASCO|nr:hypothetical protein TRICI_003029 [Trichomonascus ciferrii]
MSRSDVVLKMKLILLTAIAASLSQAVANPVPEAEPDAIANPEAAAEAWANADSQCYQNCGRAMTEYNKCKDRGKGFHNCVCNSNSNFHHFYDQCIKCPNNILFKFNRALSNPERECHLARPR